MIERIGTIVGLSLVALAGPCLGQTGALSDDGATLVLTRGTVVVGDGRVLPDTSLVVRDGRIAALGRNISVPPGAQTYDLRGRRVYPGLIDALAERPRPASGDGGAAARLVPLHADARAVDQLPDEAEAARWRAGGVLAAHVAPGEGIFRGLTALVNLGGRAARQIVRAPVAMNVSLRGLGYRNRVPGMGEPGGEFPTRLIGVLGFVRQTLLDARLLDESAPGAVPRELKGPDVRASLEALRAVARREMPVILPAHEDRELRRALGLAAELKLTPILAGGHEASGVAADLKSRGVPLLVGLDFPGPDADVHPSLQVPLRVLGHWRRAPASAGELARRGVRIAFASGALPDGSAFLARLRTAVRAGLPKDAAVRAATLGAAEILGVATELGSIAPGKLANLVVSEGDLLEEAGRIAAVFVGGVRYDVEPPATGATQAQPAAALGDPFLSLVPDLGRVVLIRNANLMTVSHGTRKRTSLLVRDGRIAAIGPELAAPAGAHVVEADGQWITPGFVDCHSHIATDSHNESGANVTSLTGTRDTLNPNDIAIYRTLAAGVTVANVLHGSVNAIGGKTVVIKNRWGRTADEMLFAGAKPGLKFAIKEFAARRGVSPPSSWMGVQGLLREQLTRARHYAMEWDDYEARRAAGTAAAAPRRDLALEPLVEVMRAERYLHVHCYTAEEITLVMRVAEEFGFRVRVLQHATNGYQVAPEIARHGGAGASIFADLGGASPYNAAILTRSGVLVSVNSDGEDLARHFNQDVGRLMKFGDLSEDEALALITLNPARQLGIDDRVGSLDVGKDADLVVFDRHPLSVYAVPQLVFVDGRLSYSSAAERERERRVDVARRALAAAREASDAR